MIRSRVVLALGLTLLLSAGARCREDDQPSAPRFQGVYVSLGDSVAAGNGSSDSATTSFAALLAGDEGVESVNLAVPGATTQDVIDRQLPLVRELLAGRQAAFITVSAGGNDLAALIPNASCQEDPPPATCPLDDALAGVERRYTSLLGRLREDLGNVPVVLLSYPNFFSGTGHPFEAPAARVLPRLDQVIERVAAADGHARVAQPWLLFDGRGPQFTHVLDVPFDPHPNDAGHRLIADAFESALDLAR